MTDTDVDRDLEDLLRDTLRAAAASTPERAVPRRSRAVLATAAATVILVAGVIGVVVAVGRDGEDASTPGSGPDSPPTTLSDDPLLLAPPDAEGWDEFRVQFADGTTASHGVVLSPSGERFDVRADVDVCDPDLSDDCGELIGDVREVAGIDVRATDGVRYDAIEDCIALTVDVPPAAGPWPAELDDLLGGVTIGDGHVGIRLPDGWTSLGVAAYERTYRFTFQAPRDDGTGLNARLVLYLAVDRDLTGAAGGAPVTSLQVRGVDAVTWKDGIRRSLAFDIGGVSAQLSEDGGSSSSLGLERLVEIADGLIEQRASEIEQRVDAFPQFTIPPTPACGSVDLSITGGTSVG